MSSEAGVPVQSKEKKSTNVLWKNLEDTKSFLPFIATTPNIVTDIRQQAYTLQEQHQFLPKTMISIISC